MLSFLLYVYIQNKKNYHSKHRAFIKLVRVSLLSENKKMTIIFEYIENYTCVCIEQKVN